MANSKKPSARSESDLLRQAVLDCLARAAQGRESAVHGLASAPAPRRVAIAYSGGIDSSVLLHILAGLPGIDAIALHVHHGLSPNADAWLAHCMTQCAKFDVPMACRHIKIECAPGESLEAAARSARYEALQDLCAQHDTSLLMTGHHADDQAETVLINLLRGSGVAGLAGMAAERPLAGITLARPFLALDADILHTYARQHDIRHIEDESNRDTRFTRNAIRHHLLPALRKIAPTATQRLAQSAAHAGEAQALLEEIGHDDLAICELRDGTLGHDAVRQLSPARAANVLRTWFRSLGLQAPSSAVLADMLRQIRRGAADSQLAIEHDGHVLRAYRDCLWLETGRAVEEQREEISFTWAGQTRLDFPQWQGRLCFVHTASAGIPASWLSGQTLRLSPRRGGERLKLHPQRPSRSLKNLYQESAIPAWQRTRLPLLHAGHRLLMAGGLGMDVRLLHATSGPNDNLLTLDWESLGH